MRFYTSCDEPNHACLASGFELRSDLGCSSALLSVQDMSDRWARRVLCWFVLYVEAVVGNTALEGRVVCRAWCSFRKTRVRLTSINAAAKPNEARWKSCCEDAAKAGALRKQVGEIIGQHPSQLQAMETSRVQVEGAAEVFLSTGLEITNPPL